ncbi:Asp-tRNA(Asn)/Glu-tRNA(Gln) amidotransferase subunit GatB [Candidatus Kaiserbacteria bacterium]|nr:Asp-tRNA(Asn)/Glu-tRNA(Gln) amidotransferase subunit GatB [Candidatus Kaiserbacteria bacterium]
MAVYEPTIGLEIHAELKTRTKMFCDSANDPFTAEANTHICPVCLAHPGTLPVINAEAVKHVLRVGLALKGELADYTEFDRKNYFYPDLPKGYQLSQYEFPLVKGGELSGVQITRVHLEEDTASSIHDEKTGATLVDYNRAGVPLMELVTEPVISSAEHAGRFARDLQLLLRYLGASEANMERGEMRVEANVSLGQNGVYGTKVEIKNLNSFRAMERAVAYELDRQKKLIESGGTVVQETRGWDESKQATFSQRIKEGSADYRYFPDPDLPFLKLSELPEFHPDILRDALSELPEDRRKRYRDLALQSDDIELLVRDRRFGDYFDEVTKIAAVEYNTAINYVANDLVKIIRDIEERDTKSLDKIPISATHFAKLIEMIQMKTVSSRSAKDILTALVSHDQDPEVYAKAEGLLQETNIEKLREVALRILNRHGQVAEDYKAGKDSALEFLLGQSMKELKGAGDPEMLREILRSLIR